MKLDGMLALLGYPENTVEYCIPFLLILVRILTVLYNTILVLYSAFLPYGTWHFSMASKNADKPHPKNDFD